MKEKKTKKCQKISVFSILINFKFRMPRTLSTVSSSFAKSLAKSSLLQQQQEHLDTSRPTGEEVTSIIIVSKGFFCLIGGKRLCLYSKIGDTWEFAKTRDYVIPSSEASTANSSLTQFAPSQISNDKEPLSSSQVMWKVVVSPKEEHILVLTSKQQLYSVSDMAKDQLIESRVNFLILISNFNYFFIFF
jgi:hypothetical protein